jgi:quercetin dioxygenase-like cupin family protein
MTIPHYANLREQVIFSEMGPHPQSLFETAKFKVVVAGLEAGQQIPLHPEGAGVFYFLQGTGWMLVGEERFAIQEGATVIVPEGVARGMEAESRLAFLATRVY